MLTLPGSCEAQVLPALLHPEEAVLYRALQWHPGTDLRREWTVPAQHGLNCPV